MNLIPSQNCNIIWHTRVPLHPSTRPGSLLQDTSVAIAYKDLFGNSPEDHHTSSYPTCPRAHQASILSCSVRRLDTAPWCRFT